jgi:hypothetical protein
MPTARSGKRPRQNPEPRIAAHGDYGSRRRCFARDQAREARGHARPTPGRLRLSATTEVRNRSPGTAPAGALVARWLLGCRETARHAAARSDIGTGGVALEPA